LAVLVGSCGWAYEEWEGLFYPRGSKNKLELYTHFFETVEVDSTFYRMPGPSMVSSWISNSPAGFVFSLKLPSTITHEKRLGLRGRVDGELSAFIESVAPLRESGRMGVILVQLPSMFRRSRGSIQGLEGFLARLPSDYRWAVEFRSRGWWVPETWEMLSRYSVGFVCVDAPGLPDNLVTTTDFAYVRIHGRAEKPWYNYLYSEEELRPWASKIMDAEASVKQVYLYLNNHHMTYAVVNSLQLLRLLGRARPEHVELENRLLAALRGPTPSPTLLSYLEEGETTLPEGVERFTTPSRLASAAQIGRSQVHIQLVSDSRVTAFVRGYFIDIDRRSRRLRHNCEDFRKHADDRLLCKHILALLRVISPLVADGFIRDLASRRDDWAFESRSSF
jgi:uncharacterized protein YecE (DUF72 family)